MDLDGARSAHWTPSRRVRHTGRSQAERPLGPALNLRYGSCHGEPPDYSCLPYTEVDVGCALFSCRPQPYLRPLPKSRGYYTGAVSSGFQDRNDFQCARVNNDDLIADQEELVSPPIRIDRYDFAWKRMEMD